MKEEINYLPVHMICDGYDVTFDTKRKFDLMIVTNEILKIYEKNNILEIQYDQINKIDISLCSIMDFYTLTTVWFNFHIFISIFDKNNNIYYLESVNDDVFIPFLEILHDKNIPIEDKLGLEKIYIDYPDKVNRNRYLERNMRKKTKELNIKYPTRVFMGKIGKL